MVLYIYLHCGVWIYALDSVTLNFAQDPTVHQHWPYCLMPFFVFIVRKPKYSLKG